MALRWLFGDSILFEGGAVLHPMAFDIEVVTDVTRYMRRDGSNLKPTLVVRKWELGLAMPTDTPVNVEKLNELSAYERRHLVLESKGDTAAGETSLSIDFRSDAQFRIDSQNVDSELVALIVGHLRGTGRLRLSWRRMAPMAPPLFALVTTGLGIWALTSSGANLATVLFALALLLALWVYAGIASWRLHLHSQMKPAGARFREAPRAEVRERLRNAKATTIVSLITIPAGAIIGAIVTTWLDG